MDTSPNVHLGRNIRKIRELLDVKQDGLAQAMDVSQQTISIIENSAFVENFRLEGIACALGLTVEAIKKFNEHEILRIISNTKRDKVNDCIYPPFNTINKIVELYERLIQAEKEKTCFLEKITNQNLNKS